MKKVLIGFIIGVILGIGGGFWWGWEMHKPSDFERWYQGQIEKYIPQDMTKHKTRHYYLMGKG